MARCWVAPFFFFFFFFLSCAVGGGGGRGVENHSPEETYPLSWDVSLVLGCLRRNMQEYLKKILI